LRLITLNDGASSDHNDLLIHLFTQLTSAPIKAFAEWAYKLYVDYLEAKLTTMTPTTLLKDADDKAQVLRHAGQWQDTETPAVMALQAAFNQQRQESHQTIQHLMAHIRQIHRRLPHRQQYTPKHPDGDQMAPPTLILHGWLLPLNILQRSRRLTTEFTLGALNVDGVRAFGSVTIPPGLTWTIIVLNVGIRKAQKSVPTSGPLLTFLHLNRKPSILAINSRPTNQKRYMDSYLSWTTWIAISLPVKILLVTQLSFLNSIDCLNLACPTYSRQHCVP